MVFTLRAPLASQNEANHRRNHDDHQEQPAPERTRSGDRDGDRDARHHRTGRPADPIPAAGRAGSRAGPGFHGGHRRLLRRAADAPRPVLRPAAVPVRARLRPGRHGARDRRGRRPGAGRHRGWPRWSRSAAGPATSLVDAADVVPVPDGLDAAEAETVVVNGITAWQMLHRKARVRAGQTVLVHGANGGVGSVLVQLAQAAGRAGDRHAPAPPPRRAARLGVVPVDYARGTRPRGSANWPPAGWTPSSTTSAAPASSTPGACWRPAAPSSPTAARPACAAPDSVCSIVCPAAHPADAVEPACPTGGTPRSTTSGSGTGAAPAAFRARQRDDLTAVLPAARRRGADRPGRRADPAHQRHPGHGTCRVAHRLRQGHPHSVSPRLRMAVRRCPPPSTTRRADRHRPTTAAEHPPPGRPSNSPNAVPSQPTRSGARALGRTASPEGYRRDDPAGLQGSRPARDDNRSSARWRLSTRVVPLSPSRRASIGRRDQLRRMRI